CRFRLPPMCPADTSAEKPSRPWLARLKQGLSATREKLGQQITTAFARSTKLDEETLEELETTLLSADVGVAATAHRLGARSKRARSGGGTPPVNILRASLVDMLTPLESPFAVGSQRPFVIMLAGVNGAGKTTSIGKLARRFQQQGLSVMLAAGDTFRAAAG